MELLNTTNMCKNWIWAVCTFSHNAKKGSKSKETNLNNLHNHIFRPLLSDIKEPIHHCQKTVYNLILGELDFGLDWNLELDWNH